jgi:hypothetical protein
MNDKLNEDEQEADTSEIFKVNTEVDDSMIVAPTTPMASDDEDEREARVTDAMRLAIGIRSTQLLVQVPGDFPLV